MRAAEVTKLRSQVLKLLRSKSYDEAMSLCSNVLHRAPEDQLHRVHHYIAWIEWDRGNRDRAVSSLRVAIEMQPDWVQHHFELAEYLFELAHLGAARTSALRVVDLEQQRGAIAFLDVAHAMLMMIFAAEGNRQEARKHLDLISGDEVLVCDRLYTRKDLLELL